MSLSPLPKGRFDAAWMIATWFGCGLSPVAPGTAGSLDEVVSGLAPGVTELYLEPAVDTPELRAMDPDWSARVDEHQALTSVDGLRAAVKSAGVQLIGFRELRRAMAAAPPSP